MGWPDEVRSEVRRILRLNWDVRNGTKVPEAEDITLSNQAVKLRGAVLYADLVESTSLVSGYTDWFAAQIYKSYLYGACRAIGQNGGVITAFDGDRVMAVFIGPGMATAAVRTALQINGVVSDIINPEIAARGFQVPYTMRHCVGIDMSDLFIAKTGVRKANDLVWVGRAANYAAKLCSERGTNYTTLITPEVYGEMDTSVTYSLQHQHMWDVAKLSEPSIVIYVSTYKWIL